MRSKTGLLATQDAIQEEHQTTPGSPVFLQRRNQPLNAQPRLMSSDFGRYRDYPNNELVMLTRNLDLGVQLSQSRGTSYKTDFDLMLAGLVPSILPVDPA